MSQPFKQNESNSNNSPPFHLFKRPTCLGSKTWVDTQYACFKDECELCQWFWGVFFNEEEYDYEPRIDE